MLTGAEAKQEVVRCEEEDPWNIKQRSDGKPTWAVVYVGKYANGRDAYRKERWKTWTLEP
jgi:hypothetical protein